MQRLYYTCTKCGETWESKMKMPPVPCMKPGVYGEGIVRPATPEEIEDYERMFVDW